MNLILCRNRTLGSALLRLAMWSRWSHAAIHDTREGWVYDARFWRGVRRAPYEAWLADYAPSRLERRDLEVPEHALPRARMWLMDQVGRPYDWTAIVGFVFRQRRWQSERAWFCSELAEAFRTLFSLRPIFRADASRITPRDQDIVI